MANLGKVELSITGMPQLLADIRAEVARLLRAMAEDEAPDIALRLREIAATFEAGQEVQR